MKMAGHDVRRRLAVMGSTLVVTPLAGNVARPLQRRYPSSKIVRVGRRLGGSNAHDLFVDGLLGIAERCTDLRRIGPLPRLLRGKGARAVARILDDDQFATRPRLKPWGDQRPANIESAMDQNSRNTC